MAARRCRLRGIPSSRESVMPWHKLAAPFFVSALWLAGSGASGHAQTPAQWRASQVAAVDKAERIMHEADKRKGLLPRYEVMLRGAYAGDENPAFPVIFGQYLSWYQTYVGDYPNAEASFTIQETLQKGDHPSPVGDPAWHARPALEAIPELARGRRAVFFNEAHHIPLTRTLTVQLLARLRRDGFNYFAAETLYQSDTGLQARGYPIEGSGFYTNEPICAEMVRTALKLGFKVVAYESESEGSADAREANQARNLYERVFKHDPTARLVVDAGYAHIVEQGPYLGGSSMAEHLARISDIDPLTVEQTMLIPHRASDHDHPYYTAAMQQLRPKAPIVFLRDDDTPWALRDGYDVSVWFPPAHLRRGRPSWLDLGGLRHPYFVAGETTCNQHYPCLIEARYAEEDIDAIPADRLLLDPPTAYTRNDHVRPVQGATSSELYLRPGKYKLSVSDASGRVFSRRSITVADGASP
jgi:hypothetical protein